MLFEDRLSAVIGDRRSGQRIDVRLRKARRAVAAGQDIDQIQFYDTRNLADGLLGFGGLTHDGYGPLPCGFRRGSLRSP